MRFTVVVMQLDGSVTDRQEYTSAEVDAGRVERIAAGACRSLLREKVPPAWEGVARFEVPCDPNGTSKRAWRQPTRYTAFAHFGVGGRTALTCAFLPGREFIPDLVTAHFYEEFLREWPPAQVAGATIRLPPERPLVVCTPWPTPVSEGEQQRLFLTTVGLAVAFFERAASEGQFSAN
jgi:hypothetical protein